MNGKIGGYISRANSRTRTGDLRVTNALLYQLSYIGFINPGAKITFY